MKPTLQLKLSQHLTLTPQLQQSIRLLQLSTLELNAEVERMLQENPLLEKSDEDEEGGGADAGASVAPAPAEVPETVRTSEADDERAEEPVDTADAAERGVPANEVEFAEEGGFGDGDWGSAPPADDDDEFYPQQVASSTLRDHLVSQLGMLSLPQRDRQLVAALIDAPDDAAGALAVQRREGDHAEARERPRRLGPLQERRRGERQRSDQHQCERQPRAR